MSSQPLPTSQVSTENSGSQISEIIGASDPVRGLRHSIDVLSRSELPVLIEGESGTGKELVARAIHRLSSRSGRSFITENCGAFPASLVEAELFGHEKGAFTGAADSRPGIFERSHGGTIFLDEIGEMDLGIQKKLLRVLQERVVRRVGGQTSIDIDFRVLSATNRVLEDLVSAGSFREDLYYRLNVATITLPPLRSRPTDIPLLVKSFNQRFSDEITRPPIEFAPRTMECLLDYHWPGNIRELQNEIWRLVSTGSNLVQVEHLSLRIQRNSRRARSRKIHNQRAMNLAQIERELLGPIVREAFEEANQNYTEAAKRLNVSRSGLYRRMKRYGISRQERKQ